MRRLFWIVLGLIALFLFLRSRVRVVRVAHPAALRAGEQVVVTSGEWEGHIGVIVGSPAETREIQVELDTAQGRIVKLFPLDQLTRRA